MEVQDWLHSTLEKFLQDLSSLLTLSCLRWVSLVEFVFPFEYLNIFLQFDICDVQACPSTDGFKFVVQVMSMALKKSFTQSAGPKN